MEVFLHALLEIMIDQTTNQQTDIRVHRETTLRILEYFLKLKKGFYFRKRTLKKNCNCHKSPNDKFTLNSHINKYIICIVIKKKYEVPDLHNIMSCILKLVVAETLINISSRFNI